LGSHRNAEAYEKADSNPSGIKPRRIPGRDKRLNEVFSEFAATPVTGLTLQQVSARVGGITIISRWFPTKGQLCLISRKSEFCRNLYQMFSRRPNFGKWLAMKKRISYRLFPNQRTKSHVLADARMIKPADSTGP